VVEMDSSKVRFRPEVPLESNSSASYSLSVITGRLRIINNLLNAMHCPFNHYP
jgi:hypothetical protein